MQTCRLRQYRTRDPPVGGEFRQTRVAFDPFDQQFGFSIPSRASLHLSCNSDFLAQPLGFRFLIRRSSSFGLFGLS